MLDNLTQRLGRAMKALRGEARLTENNIQDALREVRLALLEADVALPVVKQFITAVRDKAVGQEVLSSLSPGQALVGVVQRELAALMGGAAAPLNLATTPPAVILLAGLQGSGKTTTAAKLARRVRDDARKKVLLVSCDVYRPAAMDQLETLAKELGIDCFAATPDAQPLTIARAALDWARRHYHDVLIVDTAGRLSIDEAMMREIAELHAALNPVETPFIVDAMQGQDAVNTASAFGAALPLTGIVLTKLDGDARGGAALSVRQVTGAPIKFAGVSEKLNGLEVFHPDRMASRILRRPSLSSLLFLSRRNIGASLPLAGRCPRAAYRRDSTTLAHAARGGVRRRCPPGERVTRACRHRSQGHSTTVDGNCNRFVRERTSVPPVCRRAPIGSTQPGGPRPHPTRLRGRRRERQPRTVVGEVRAPLARRAPAPVP